MMNTNDMDSGLFFVSVVIMSLVALRLIWCILDTHAKISRLEADWFSDDEDDDEPDQ